MVGPQLRRTDSFGGFTTTAARLRPLVEPLGWLTSELIDSASSTLNFFSGWVPEVSKWSGLSHVLLVVWT